MTVNADKTVTANFVVQTFTLTANFTPSGSGFVTDNATGGALINTVWSVSRDDGRPAVNQMLLQPFINYNFPDAPGRFLSFSPIITANWKAESGQQWTIPLGLGIGQILKIGQ